MSRPFRLALLALALSVAGIARVPTQTPPRPATPPDPVRRLVARLDLERFKATIKGLTQFGDRRHGTDRNRRAVDWIEARLRADGCTPERMKFTYTPPGAHPARRARRAARPEPDVPPTAVGGGRPRGVPAATPRPTAT